MVVSRKAKEEAAITPTGLKTHYTREYFTGRMLWKFEMVP